MSITSEYYGRTQNGEDVYCYTMTNTHGMQAKILEYGCTITHLLVPDQTGTLQDVVLGYRTLEDYEAGNMSVGAFVGRCANRIENACFTLDGKTYRLEQNDGANHLHGTFSRMVFKGSMQGDSLVLTATSPDGDDGFPGSIALTVTYTLTDENSLVLDYTATTDAPTLLNLTNHSYFNLNGQTGKDIRSTHLQIFADAFCEGNEQTCPTGRILPVKGTVFDFTAPRDIGAHLDGDDPQLTMAKGYDHNFVLRKQPDELARVCIACADDTGICMETYTTQPGMQLYTGNYLGKPGPNGKAGRPYADYDGFCLETQHFPCTPSHPEFPSIVLRPEEEYHQTTIYKFSLQ